MKLHKEPLIHFLLIGAALFALYTVLNRGAATSPDELVVSAGQIENLAATFSRVCQRAPSAEELKGLIDAYVKEEILSREAIKLGLDRDDPVIRRRLQQKMEFFAEDFASLAAPTDAELSAYLASHPEKFQQDARFTFHHVYLNPNHRGDSLQSDALELLAQLGQVGTQTNIADLGDRLLLPQHFVKETWAAVSAQFGEEFVEALGAVPSGEWCGPIRSGYGQHLVFVTERTDARMPALDEVRARVERSLVTARRDESNQRFLDGLLESYTVTVEWPEAEAAPPTAQPTTAMRP